MATYQYKTEELKEKLNKIVEAAENTFKPDDMAIVIGGMKFTGFAEDQFTTIEKQPEYTVKDLALYPKEHPDHNPALLLVQGYCTEAGGYYSFKVRKDSETGRMLLEDKDGSVIKLSYSNTKKDSEE